MKKIGRALAVLSSAVALPLAMTGTAYADIPFNQPVNGNATYYNDSGFGACGTWLNAATEMLVAVPASYWSTPNPNNDPLCTGVSVQVTYNGRTITVPVRDKCPSCDSAHIDLSQPAFARLADPNLGNIRLTWKFVRS
ncbi:cysteine/serine endopeptidase inhibitor [Actinophytocola sp.]|uniref:cysteine/serine endopeptidase inhibitor n=1 Tax=Actinophytocola sp. TaxID=1872138 RepID=UPI002D626D82|nr:cysteine/serine endopeptidase inhibitor [Actinophytocola sp.]HYQ69493.1 cysteine/serine endopeptidase inhibitor [Actinophytocola sp.]